MPKKDRRITEHAPNPKRADAKKKRGKGILAMEEKGMDQATWVQKHDPLFRVKGKERHERMWEVR